MKTFLFFAVTGSLLVALVHWIRSLPCDRRVSSVTLDRIDENCEDL